MIPRLDIAIVAHSDRREMAEKLCCATDANLIVWDAGDGPRETHERAWTQLAAQLPAHWRDRHWAMVIEDDAIAVSPFRATMAAALAKAPTTIVSAYLGRGRPINWQPAIAAVMAAQVDWLIAEAVLHGVGLAMRGDKITDMLDSTMRTLPAARRWATPMDEAIDRWARRMNIRTSYTHPSLLDHDPELPSLIGADRARTHTVSVPKIHGAHLDPDYRKAWHFASQQTWGDSCEVIPSPEIPQV